MAKGKYTIGEKIAYYTGRVSDANLTEEDRQKARDWLAENGIGIDGKIKSSTKSATKSASPKESAVPSEPGKKKGLAVKVILTRTKNGKPFANAYIDK
jgi:hypothetical protein